MTEKAIASVSATGSKSLNIALWAVQSLLALTFVGTFFWKVFTPIEKLAQMIPWAGENTALLYTTAVFDLLGGIGVIVPAVNRIKPGLTVLAAVGCAALQVAAIVFHLSRGEGSNTPFNFFLVGLSLFVAWGRWKKVPIECRTDRMPQ